MSGERQGRTLRLGTTDRDLDRAARLLRAGELVAIPTETVYGLAVRADDAEAVTRLFAAKQRPTDNPLIVHVASLEEVTRVAQEVTPLARLLLSRLAPGPLTVVLPARRDVPRAVTGGLSTVAVRIPDHPVMRAVLERSDLALAAPSANRSGRPSPTSAAHVLADLDGRIRAVIDDGPTRIGLESTVVDARGADWRILRDGGLSREAIRAALADAAPPDPHAGRRAGGPEEGFRATTGAASPGTRHRHYAPALPVHLVPPGAGWALAVRRASDAASTTIGLVANVRDLPADRTTPTGVRLLATPEDATTLAADLFAVLRRAEDVGLDELVVEAVADDGIGRAVMDRLRRAVAASGGSDLTVSSATAPQPSGDR